MIWESFNQRGYTNVALSIKRDPLYIDGPHSWLRAVIYIGKSVLGQEKGNICHTLRNLCKNFQTVPACRHTGKLSLFSSPALCAHCFYQTQRGKGRHQQQKNVFFRALPELPKPTPPWPQFGQLGPLFSEVEIQDLKVSLKLKILYILYNILYICNLKNS